MGRVAKRVGAVLGIILLLSIAWEVFAVIRATSRTPGILAGADAAFYGEAARPFEPEALLETMSAYAERHIAEGGRLGHITRHMVGLFHGLPGARRYRQILSTDATKPGAGPEVLREAFAAVEFNAELEAA